jgi:CRISPR-associated endonuclease/helicase Cas3
LKNERKIAVISTQLVEAGVDFDFPCVYRALAPLDAIIQAAGRCNRNGKPKKGRVVLFNLEQQKMPDKTYRAAADLALRMIKDDPELLHKADSFEQYYEAFTTLFVDTDKYDITENRRNGNFKTVAENFRLIDSPTVSLFIKDYSADSKSLLKEIEDARFITREHFRRLQQFSVQVYPNFLRDNALQIEHYQNEIRIWLGKYDGKVGLAPEDVETVF